MNRAPVNRKQRLPAMRISEKTAAVEQPHRKMLHNQMTDSIPYMVRTKGKLNVMNQTVSFSYNDATLALTYLNDKKTDMPVSVSKLICQAQVEFTALNTVKDKNNPVLEVYIDLNEYIRKAYPNTIEQKMDNPTKQAKEHRRAIYARNNARNAVDRDLGRISGSKMVRKNNVFTEEGESKSTSSYTMCFQKAELQENNIYFMFSQPFAKQLLSMPIITYYPDSLLAIDGRYQNAYKIATSMYLHYNITANQKKGTASRLKVSSILAKTSLPTLDQLNKTKDRGHWRERIKDSFEDSLEYLVQIGVLANYEYVLPKGEEMTMVEASELEESYQKWTDALVQYELAGAVDHQKLLADAADSKKNKRKKK